MGIISAQTARGDSESRRKSRRTSTSARTRYRDKALELDPLFSPFWFSSEKGNLQFISKHQYRPIACIADDDGWWYFWRISIKLNLFPTPFYFTVKYKAGQSDTRTPGPDDIGNSSQKKTLDKLFRMATLFYTYFSLSLCKHV